MNQSFQWKGGDWTTKYAPWARGKGSDGPRGVTPPAGMWVLSAENFYYGAFYMLSQLGLNLEGQDLPTGTNCWMWELDPVEGTAGWEPGKPLPGNLNMAYSTENAQASGCMPVSYTSSQANGLRGSYKFPEDFRAQCASKPEQAGCRPWAEKIHWGGGQQGTQRFENLWDEPYVFAVLVDAKGYWIYRWRPGAYSQAKGLSDPSSVLTGWPGLERFSASRTLPPRPAPVVDPRGLRTDVPGDAPEAVILQPGLSPEAVCLRASVEEVTWQWGTDALAAMAQEMGGSHFEGLQNWWSSFTDTLQNANYPPSIMGLEASDMTESLECNTGGSFTCACEARRREKLLGSSQVFV